MGLSSQQKSLQKPQLPGRPSLPISVGAIQGAFQDDLGGQQAVQGGEQQGPAVKDTFSFSGHPSTPLFHTSDRWVRGPEAIIAGFCWCLWCT